MDGGHCHEQCARRRPSCLASNDYDARATGLVVERRRQRVAQRGARGDPVLREDPVQVAADGAVRRSTASSEYLATQPLSRVAAMRQARCMMRQPWRIYLRRAPAAQHRPVPDGSADPGESNDRPRGSSAYAACTSSGSGGRAAGARPAGLSPAAARRGEARPRVSSRRRDHREPRARCLALHKPPGPALPRDDWPLRLSRFANRRIMRHHWRS
jgi:hypothetical protein